jgi:hypothetical protein
MDESQPLAAAPQDHRPGIAIVWSGDRLFIWGGRPPGAAGPVDDGQVWLHPAAATRP